MKRTRLFGIAILPLAFVLALAFWGQREQSEPSFSDLRAEDIEHIDAIWGDQPYYYALSEEDQELLVGYLQQLELGERVSNFLDYDGVNGEQFALRMESGETIIVSASSPLVVVDYIGYRCDNYDVCHVISDIYWRYADMIRAQATGT